MARYHVNTKAQPNGDHEVHVTGCTHDAFPNHRKDLGEHLTCHTAVTTAKITYPTADGCHWCSPECDTR